MCCNLPLIALPMIPVLRYRQEGTYTVPCIITGYPYRQPVHDNPSSSCLRVDAGLPYTLTHPHYAVLLCGTCRQKEIADAMAKMPNLIEEYRVSYGAMQ